MGIWREVRIQAELFDLGIEEKNIRIHAKNSGALVAFQGMVREFNQPDTTNQSNISSIFLEHYPIITEKEIERVIDEAINRWALQAVQVIHRVGTLHASEPIVLVITCSKHRIDAFHSAQFIMDFLKTQVPFWKREHHADGKSHWVEAKHSDADAQKKWEQPS